MTQASVEVYPVPVLPQKESKSGRRKRRVCVQEDFTVTPKASSCVARKLEMPINQHERRTPRRQRKKGNNCVSKQASQPLLHMNPKASDHGAKSATRHMAATNPQETSRSDPSKVVPALSRETLPHTATQTNGP